MIVWKGWGILSVLVAAATFFAGAYIGDALIGSAPHSSGVRYGAAFGLAIGAVVNWFIGRSLNQPKREAAAGVFNRHSLFFVPMEYWSIALLLVSIVSLQMARE